MSETITSNALSVQAPPRFASIASSEPVPCSAEMALSL
jgi:hypothetical protein